ncbi:MAG: hypothetical protein KDD63_07940, partial [Bacteroidetes bacterium]|nr:hypothetical protein [Bacteroidota bacterium]
APRFWQKQNNFPEKDVTFSPAGRSFHIGNQGQNAWVSAYRPDGAVLWFKKFDQLSFQDIVFSHNKLFVVGKTQQANSNGFLLCLDMNGTVVWMNEYQTSFASGFHIISNNDSSLMVAGYVASLPDTSMVLAEFSQTGATKWMKKLGNVGNNWIPVDLDVSSNGHWAVLGRENTDRSFFTVVKTNNLLSGTLNTQGQGSQGQSSQGQSTKTTVTKSNSKAVQNQPASQSLVVPLFDTYFFNKTNGQLIPKGAIENQINGNYNLAFIVIDSTGEKSVRLVNFDEEQESLSNIRRVLIGSTVHSDIKITGGYNTDLFLLSASADSANVGGESVFLHLDETGIINQRKFLWSDNDPRLSWLASHPLAGVNFSVSSGGNNM